MRSVQGFNPMSLLSPPPPRIHPRARDSDTETANRIHRDLKAGSIKKAARRPVAEPLADINPETIQQLLALHPQSDPPRIPHPDAPPLLLTHKILKKVIKRFPRASAAGLSGLTFEQLGAALKGSMNMRDQVITFVNRALRGDLQPMPEMLASRLLALQKSKGGIRPIAVGEVFMRFCCLCAIELCSDAGPGLAPIQLGVGVAGGAQCIGHALRAGAKAHPDHVTCATDFRNAFNTISRDAILQAVSERHPELFPFVHWAYSSPAELWVQGGPNGHELLWSTTGVRQGDPIGPLLFSLGLQGPLEEVARDFPEVRVVAYLDDVYLQGLPEHVEPAYRRLCELCKGIGLEMAPQKCEVWSPGDPAAAELLAESLGMKFADQGFVAAGCPLGSTEFVQQHADSAAEKVVSLIQRVLALPLSAQDKLLLLRRSLQLKILHLSRVARKAEVLDAVSKVEREIVAGILHIMKCSDADVDTAQITLPVRLGGLGVHLMSDEDGAACDAAFLSAAALTRRAVCGGSEHFDPFKGDLGVELTGLWSELYGRVLTCMKESTTSRLSPELTDAMIEGMLPGFAHSVLAELAEQRQTELLGRLSAEGVKRLESVADTTAGAWMDAMPVASTCHLGDGDVVGSLRYMLGVCPAALQDRPLSCECGKPFSPGQAMRCSCCAGVRTVCHDISVESGWRACVHKSGQASTREPADVDFQGVGILDPAFVNGKRVDFHVFDPSGSVGADVMIVDPTAPSYSRLDEVRMFRKFESAKREKHTFNGATMVPLVMTTFGKLGPSAEWYLQTLATVACSTGVVDRGMWLRIARQYISCALVRGRGIVFRHYYRSMAKSAGKDFRDGAVVPFE